MAVWSRTEWTAECLVTPERPMRWSKDIIVADPLTEDSAWVSSR